MLKNILHEGALAGLIFGIISSMFDGLYMLDTGLYIPVSYPVSLFLFNIFFWISTGIVSAAISAHQSASSQRVRFKSSLSY